jgi:Flp pilus assembly protein TadG
MRLPHLKSLEKTQPRRGASAVELAVLLPFLIFCSMISVDFARMAYVQVVLQSCARNGALYEFYTKAGFPLPSTWSSLSAAVNADVPSGMTVTYTSSSPASATNNTVTVTVTTTYNLISMGASSYFPALPASITLSQSAQMPYPNGQSPVN